MHSKERAPIKIFKGTVTTDGAGVKLTRVFGSTDTALTDPFLLLDCFGSKNPDEYIKGFPWHPHRGIETVTYMIAGRVEHGDSLGNKGTIETGDIQWMTAGSGIIHQEMPQVSRPALKGFQLWVNLPAAQKMIPPKYRDIKGSALPSVELDGSHIKIICGSFGDTHGPADDITMNPTYFDIHAQPQCSLSLPSPEGSTVIAFVYEGDITCAGIIISADECAVFGQGDLVEVKAGSSGAKYIFLAGTPLHEPIAWGGPIVMNTRKELDTAFRELDEGIFIK